MTYLHLAWLLVLVACGSTPRTAEQAAEDAATLVGTWTTSVESYAGAEQSTEAVQFTSDGVVRQGDWTAEGFVALPGSGPSGPDFVMRYVVDPTTRTLLAQLDGAEERGAYMIDGPDRFRTHSGPPHDVTIFYVRRR